MQDTTQAPGANNPFGKVTPVFELPNRQDRLAREASQKKHLEALRIQNQSWGEEWGKAFRLDGGGVTMRGLGRWVNKMRHGDEWEEYKPTVEDYNKILVDNKLQGNEYNRKYLATATSREELQARAEELRLQQELSNDLQNAGVKRFTAGVLNVPENLAMLGAGAVTGGAGAVAVLGARATRVAQTAGTTAAMLGIMHFDETQGGKEYSVTDYVAAGAMVGGLTHLVGAKTIDARTGGAYTKAMQELQAPKITPQGVQLPPRSTGKATPFSAAERSAANPNAIRILTDTTQDAVAKWHQSATAAVQAARTAPQLRALSAEFRQLRKELQELPSAQVGTVTDYTPAAGTISEATGKKLTRAERRELGREARKAAKNEPNPEVQQRVERQAEIREEARAAQDAAVAQEQLNRYKRTGELPLEVRKTMHAEEMQAYNNALRMLGEASSAASGTATLSPTAQAAAGAVARSQSGMQQAPAGVLSKVFTGFNRLVSEHEKITRGNQKLRAMVATVLDDPLARETLVKNNAATTLRANKLKAAAEMQRWEDALMRETREITGTNAVTDFAGYSEKFLQARLDLEDQVATLLLERNHAEINGWAVPPAPDTPAGRLVGIYEEVTGKTLARAQDQGLEGVQGLSARAGYFHRSYNYEKMLRVAKASDEKTVIRMLSLSMQSPTGAKLPAAEANAIATAIWNRTKNSATDARTDFMGSLGTVETDSLIQLLKESGAADEVVESISRRLTQNLEQAGTVKYAKDRIPMDMQLTYRDAAGNEWRMQDLIDTDLSRLLENYQHGMAGRGALARAGIGGDGNSIGTFKTKYLEELANMGVSQTERDGVSKQLDHIFGDFTGIRPESAVTGEYASIGKALASASMLGSTGLLQVAETGIIAAHHGYRAVVADMLKRVPGIGELLKDVGHNPKLYQEWQDVLGITFSADQRMQMWKRQLEIGQESNSAAVRYSKAMEGMTPSITGQRWVLNKQSHLAINLGLVRIAKATKGGADELKELRRLAPELDDATLQRVGEVVQWRGNSVKNFRVGALNDADLEAVQNAIIRIHDNQLLAMRPGYGTSYQRSAVGQILGQFTSYVGMAHNLISRGTYQHQGSLGIAKILAYQFPLMFMATYVNEVRKGNVLDLTDEDDLLKLAQQTMAYSAVVGLYGEAVATIWGTGGGRSVAAFNATQAPGEVISAFGSAFEGDAGSAAASVSKAVGTLTPWGAVPGVRALEQALKE